MLGQSRLRFLALVPLALLAACASTHTTTLSPALTTIQPSQHKDPAIVAGNQLFDYGHPYIIKTSPPLQCVVYARMQTGIQIHGNANHWWALAAGRYRRGQAPQTGAVLVLKGYETDRRGHVAVVRKLADSRTMIIDHANWMGRGEISRDTPVQDVSPANDWSQVRVWNIKATRWGAHVYTVEGFIYPDQAIASR